MRRLDEHHRNLTRHRITSFLALDTCAEYLCPEPKSQVPRAADAKGVTTWRCTARPAVHLVPARRDLRVLLTAASQSAAVSFE